LKSGIKPQGVEGSKKQAPKIQPNASSGKAKGKGGAKGGKRGKGRDSDEEEETKDVEDQIEIAIDQDQIKKTLLGSDMIEFKDNKDEAEILLESLTEFLEIPVNKQFQTIFLEAYERQSTKGQASSNKNLEAEAEEQF
jgi:hypothetical protein